jgi:hypothetical protein
MAQVGWDGTGGDSKGGVRHPFPVSTSLRALYFIWLPFAI